MVRVVVPAEGLAPRVERVSPEALGALIDSVDRLEDPAVARELVAVLGAKATAVAGGVGTTRLVRAWVDGHHPPSRPLSLRAALKAVRVLSAAEGPAVARRWIEGTNRFFDHRSPLEVLHDDPSATNRSKVVRAALAFISA
jgi:hypothetical protein